MKLSKPMFSITKPIMLGLVLCLLAFAHTKPVSAQEKTIFDILRSAELKLFGYYVILNNSNFLDILTENDVSAIIGELKQFQPTELDKFLHHTEDFLIYADDIAIKHDNINRFYVTYQDRQIIFSPTIDKILLRAVTDHPEMKIYYETQFATNPLFMQLADTNNNNIIPLIQLFLDNGADINAKNPTWGKTIFSYVGTLEIAQLLSANGADPTIIANNGESPLIHAIYWHRSHQLIKFLIDIGVDLHAKSSSDNTALSEAKDNVEYFINDYETENNDNYFDDPEYLEAVRARFANTREVLRIIEQALEADKKP